MRKLGHSQLAILTALKQHGSWSERGGGWTWHTPSGTKSLLNSLVRRGMVRIVTEAWGQGTREVYYPEKHV